jgi:hypothetical protein
MTQRRQSLVFNAITEGMNIDLLTKKVTIASCGGLEIPISLRAIYAAAVGANSRKYL